MGGVSQSYDIPSHIEESEKETVCQSATESSEKEGASQSYKLQLTRIKELQKLVEDELEEFETKRKVRSNVVQATETEVVNSVKGIEFKSEIKINQLVEEEEDLDNTEDDIDSIAESDISEEEVKDQEATEQESIKEEDLGQVHQNADNVEEEVEDSSQDDIDDVDDENLIHASCTLKKDNTVSISSNIVNVVQTSENKEKTDITEENEDDKNEKETCQEELESEEVQDDQDKREEELRSQLRTPPRKSLSLETKIRDRELLSSLLAENKTRESVQVEEEERKEFKEKPSILKQNKSTTTLASLNEKKQSYRIKFKVKLNDKTSKESSVIRYLFPSLFDYFHKKLFNSKH